MRKTADVVIVGGGVIGCSTAYHLAQHGVREVVLVEMAEIGAGSSSKSAAMLSVQFCQDALSVRMAKHCYEAFMRFEEEVGSPLDFHRSGWLYAATEESADALRRQAALLQAHEVQTELLAPAEIKARFPQIHCDDIALGSYGADDGPFDPHMIMTGYLRRARQMGVQVLEGTRVEGIEVRGGRVASVVTDKGTIATGVVVNAAGAWGTQVGAMVGAYVPLHNSARTIVVTHPIGAIPRDYPFVEDLGAEWYFRPELDGVLMGMGATPAAQPHVGLDEAQLEAIVEMAMHRVPALAQASLLTAWTGVRPLSPDGQAMLGAYGEPEGFLVSCGWGGVGFIMAPLAGQLLAEHVTQGAMQTFDNAPFRANRFAPEAHI
jgi:sarcosine oxidase, subunit beta